MYRFLVIHIMAKNKVSSEMYFFSPHGMHMRRAVAADKDIERMIKSLGRVDLSDAELAKAVAALCAVRGALTRLDVSVNNMTSEGVELLREAARGCMRGQQAAGGGRSAGSYQDAAGCCCRRLQDGCRRPAQEAAGWLQEAGANVGDAGWRKCGCGRLQEAA